MAAGVPLPLRRPMTDRHPATGMGPNRGPPAEPTRGRSAARAIVGAALVAVGLLFLWLTVRIDLVIFAGILLAVFLRGLTERVCAYSGLSHGWALALVVLVIVAAAAGIGWFFSQAIASQIDQLSQQLPAALGKVEQQIEQLPLGRSLVQHASPNSLAAGSGGGVVHSIFGIASNAAEFVAGIVVLLFVGLYLAAEPDVYVGGLLRLVPPARRPRAAEILGETAGALWYWMLGRLVSMSTLGTLTALGLWLLGVPLPFALGLLAGILTFVPYLGTVASAVPTLLLALAVDPKLAVYVVLLYTGIHVTEGYILVPLVQRRAAHLPPALTLSAQVVLGVLAGFLGLLLATPLTAAALVLVRMIYVEDVLDDRSAEATKRIPRDA